MIGLNKYKHMIEKIKKLKTGHIEIRTTVEHDEVVTYKPEVVEQDLKNAEEVVTQRKSELASAEKNLQHFKDLKLKISKVK